MRESKTQWSKIDYFILYTTSTTTAAADFLADDRRRLALLSFSYIDVEAKCCGLMVEGALSGSDAERNISIAPMSPIYSLLMRSSASI